jgi:NADH-quinone oxidoreductase subunit C
VSLRILERIRTVLGVRLLDSGSFHGDEVVVIAAEDLRDVIETLRSDPEIGLDWLVDLTALDRLGLELPEGAPRFEVVYHLRSMKTGERLRLKAQVDLPEDGSEPVVDTIVDLWKSANWMEREVFDMFGIKFRGHPDLRRILMYEEFVGYPLRKDYPKEKRQPLVRRDPNT